MTDINVISRTQRIIVDPVSQTVSIINAGPIGPGGPIGPEGGVTTEEAIDAVASALTEGAGIDITYNDTAGTITIASTGGVGGGTDEVWIGTTEPIDPSIELWYDPDAVPATGGGVTDGDKGDIVVSGSGAVWTVESSLITTATQTALDTKPSSTTVDTIMTLTQAAYDAIGTKDSATLYFIT